MEVLFESRSDILRTWGKLYFRQARPEILPEPVLVGDTPTDVGGVELYGTVLREGGIYRMWYQSWPKGGASGEDTILVAYAESDDGLDWRKPRLGIFDFRGDGGNNNLINLGAHQPSVFIDPDSPPSHRYRATGCVLPWQYGALPGAEGVGYYTAHSADGLRWEPDTPEPTWRPTGDNICSIYHPGQRRGIAIMKFAPRVLGFQRRSHREAELRNGVWSDSRIALVPDEFADVSARGRGYASEDYYGLTMLPAGSGTVGFLWHLRHDLPRTPETEYGLFGSVDTSLVFQEAPGTPWLHVAGRPDFITHGAPDWMGGSAYTSSCPVEVGDEHWLYFCGDSFTHGWSMDSRWHTLEHRERQFLEHGMRVGIVRWPKFRLFGFRGDAEGGLALDLGEVTVPSQLALNYNTTFDGHVRVKLAADDRGKETDIDGRGETDAVPLTGESVAGIAAWKGGTVIEPVPGKHIHAHLMLESATVYAYELRPLEK